MKGYKIFNPDLTCRGFQYEIGKEYKLEGSFKICQNGFHFCLKAQDCFNYYKFDSKNIVCEVEALGETQTHSDDSKIATNHIKIIRQLTWAEILEISNTGKDNTGHSNSGNWNSGNRNSGDSNSGYRNSGAFCTDQSPTLYLFDKPAKMTIKEWEQSKAVELMYSINTTIWIPWSSMTIEEQQNNPKLKTSEGYTKTIPIKEAWINAWGNWSEENRKVFTSLENFDADKFFEITGIKI